MKIRHVLVIAIVVVATNFVISGVSNALRRSDYNHCKITTHHTIGECRILTQYEGE